MSLRAQMFATVPPVQFGSRAAVGMGLMVILGAFCTWASFAELEEQIHASGSFIASSRSQVVQALDGGALLELNVKEGDSVQAGEIIATLDPQRYQASNDEVLAKVVALKANIARLQAEASGGRPQYPDEVSADRALVSQQNRLMAQRQRSINEDLATLEQALQLSRQELAAYQRLAATGDASESETLKAQRQVADLQGQIDSRRNKYFTETQAELSKARDELSQASQQLSQRSAVLASTQIRAPMSGLVKNVKVTTIGGVMRPGEELLEIVPTDEPLIVEAKLRPADVAFLRLGLPANIQLEAYDYTIYGSIRGEVVYVSPDTLTEDSRQGQLTYYRVQIATLDAQPLTLRGEPFDIIPGMQTRLAIRTGERTVANYLLKPLRKVASESLTER